jgi:hypothetical protein
VEIARERDLVLRANGPPGASDAVGFQFGLIEVLARAQAWILSDEEVSELESLALGPERDNVRQFHWRSPMELNLDMLFDGSAAREHKQSIYAQRHGWRVAI